MSTGIGAGGRGDPLWGVSAETLDELDGLLGLCARPLAAYHRVGELIARVRPRGPSPFDGTGWFRALARRLGCSTQLLGRCQRVYEVYSRERVVELGERGLVWSHLAVLVRVRDGGDRERLEAEAVENRWTAAELGRRAAGLTGGPALGVGGPRPLAAGYAAVLGLRHLAAAATRFAARAAQNWSGSPTPVGDQVRTLLAGYEADERRQIFRALALLLPTLGRVAAAATAERESLRRVLEEYAADAA
jgi:hypothetical protein